MSLMSLKLHQEPLARIKVAAALRGVSMMTYAERILKPAAERDIAMSTGNIEPPLSREAVSVMVSNIANQTGTPRSGQCCRSPTALVKCPADLHRPAGPLEGRLVTTRPPA